MKFMRVFPESPDLLELDEALRRLAEAVPPPALEEVRADRDDPAVDRSTMDGVALRSEDGKGPRSVLGTLYAGDDPSGVLVEPGTCVRIMTGAAMPPGADAVVPVERLIPQGEQVEPKDMPQAGDFVLKQGTQAQAGELILGEGTPLNSARIGLRAQFGRALPPLRRLTVGVAPTGSELVSTPASHQIRNSNGPMLAALAHVLGAEVREVPAIPDDPALIRGTLERMGDLDVLMTVGGVSMGEKDHLPAILRAMGARVLFHKIRLKPGKPALAAILGNTVVLALPGNPISAYLGARLFLPVVLAARLGWALQDPWKRGVLQAPVANPGARPLLQPCRCSGDQLEPLVSKGSADLVRHALADVYAWIPEGGCGPVETRYLEIL